MLGQNAIATAGRRRASVGGGPSGWVSYLDDTYWEQGTVGFGTITWDGINNRWEYDGADFRFDMIDIGTWVNGARPTFWRINYTITAIDTANGDVDLRDASANLLSNIDLVDSVGTHQSADTAIDFTGAGDIHDLYWVMYYYNTFYINDIEFYFP